MGWCFTYCAEITLLLFRQLFIAKSKKIDTIMYYYSWPVDAVVCAPGYKAEGSHSGQYLRNERKCLLCVWFISLVWDETVVCEVSSNIINIIYSYRVYFRPDSKP